MGSSARCLMRTGKWEKTSTLKAFGEDETVYAGTLLLAFFLQQHSPGHRVYAVVVRGLCVAEL